MSEAVPVRREFWIRCVLALLTLAVYWPVLNSDFINLDDDIYVSRNPDVAGGLNRSSLAWAFTTGNGGYWIPLTWLSHELDCQLYGLNAHGHHLTNLLFHVANVLLLFGLLNKMTGTLWRSAFVAALFAWHPLRVESVAWIAERKDVLSTFLGLLALWAYTSYAVAYRANPPSGAEQPPPFAGGGTKHAPPTRARLSYGLALLLYALSLMAKPMLVTMPFLMLLLDYWPLGRISDLKIRGARTFSGAPLFRLVLEKIPFLGLSGVFCMVTFLAQRAGGAVATLTELPLQLRLSNAVMSYAVYMTKLAWPRNLCVPYPYVRSWPENQVLGASLLVGAVTWVAIVMARRQRYVFVGWFWFLGTLVPTIGLVQAGGQALADRFTYVPGVGLFIMIAWGMTHLTSRLSRQKAVLAFLGSAALVGCLVGTSIQVRYWKNSVTLFERTLSLTHNNWIALCTCGAALEEQGRLDEGVSLLRQAMQLVPDAKLAGSIGFGLQKQGKIAEALQYYRECVRLNTNAVEEDPHFVSELNNLAWILATDPEAGNRNGSEAVQLAERACDLTNYKNPQIVGTLAAAYAEAGRFDDAVRAGNQAADLFEAAGNAAMAETNRNFVRIYTSHKAYHENSRSAMDRPPVPSSKP